jgi:hypothetical protein
VGGNAPVGGLAGQKMLDASVLRVADAMAKHNVFDRASDIPTSKAIVHTF